jgi:hypothetical protein
VDGARHGQAVDRLIALDRVTADDVDLCLFCLLRAAAKDLGEDSCLELVVRKTNEWRYLLQ